MLFFENYQSVEVKPEQKPAKTQPKFGKLSPEGKTVEPKFGKLCPEGRSIAKEGQTPSFRNQLHKDAYMTMLNSLKLAIQSTSTKKNWLI